MDLPDYKGMKVEVADVEVTDADIDEQLDELRGRFATVTPVERPAADGDMVVVDVLGTIDGERVEEFSGAGMTFEVGAGNMIPGFDDAVRGCPKASPPPSPIPLRTASSPTSRWTWRSRSRAFANGNYPRR